MKSATVLFTYIENGADYGKENGRCDYPGLSSGRRMETDAARTGRTDLPVHRLIVMNTGKENWKAAYEKTTIPMEVHHLTREEFDHGKTRDQAARMSRADYLLFMTQDALPEDCHLIEKLVEAMEQDEKIGAAYARQLPREDCRLMEQYTRQFNYPEESRVKWLADLPELGIKTYFVLMCAQCTGGSCICSWGGLYRRPFLMKI